MFFFLPEVPTGAQALVSLYMARREIWGPLDRLLAKFNLQVEEADFLLNVARASGTRPPAGLAPDELDTWKQEFYRITSVSLSRFRGIINRLKSAGLVVGQPHVSPQTTNPAPGVTITSTGETIASEVWAEFSWLANRLLGGIRDGDLRSHAGVCHHICQNTVALETPPSTQPGDWDRATSIRAVLEATAGLRNPLIQRTLADTKLTLERADVLVNLFLAHELPARDGMEPGFVSVAELRRSLVHSMSNSRFLLSHWLAEMKRIDQSPRARQSEGHGCLEVMDYGKLRKQVRITDKGIELIRPVWERYERFAEDVMRGIQDAELVAFREVNIAICRFAPDVR